MTSLKNSTLSFLMLILIILGISTSRSFAQTSPDPNFKSEISTGSNPWTHLRFYNDPDNFQFAIVSDRTGGLRPGVFADAVHKINWLMPEFVMSVGDFIPGVTLDETQMDKEWSEFENVLQPLKMPFFFLPGNHDISNDLMRKKWMDKFGKAHYYYVYKDVLFLALDTNPEDAVTINDKQVEYFKNVLEQHQDVRWTLVFMHHPVWNYGADIGGFQEIEKMLEGRNHTVIAGHNHRYLHTERNNTNYYILASTGGGSGLRGPKFGEFDHITLVTMTDEGPSMANLRLSGILPHDVTTMEDLLLTRNLLKSVDFETAVYLAEGKQFQNGRLQITMQNPSDLPLEVNARFFHGHQVNTSIQMISEKIPPQSDKTFDISLSAKEAIDYEELHPLQLDWTIGYDFTDASDLMLSGTREIEIVSSKIAAIQTVNPVFDDQLDIQLSNAMEDFSVHYTLDGTEPTLQSPIYSKPISITSSTEIQVKIYDENQYASAVQKKTFEKIKKGSGLKFRYYEGAWRKMPDFTNLQLVNQGVINHFGVSQLKLRESHFALELMGKLKINKSGTYTFYTTSDDGSLLYINDQLVVNNDGDHGPMTRSGEITLKKGMHDFKIEYFENIGGELLQVEFEGPEKPRSQLPFDLLSN